MHRFFLFLQRESTQSFFLYLGFVNFILALPAANIAIKNDSFRMIGGWSWHTYSLFLFLFLFAPAFLNWGIERALRVKHALWGLRFRHCLFLGGGVLFWTQLTEYHINPFLKGTFFLPDRERHVLLLIGALTFLFLIFLLRKYLAVLFTVFAPVTLLMAGLLGFQTLQSGSVLQGAPGKEAIRSDIPVYLLVFDGLSLERLMEKDQINAALFPTFARISREWTWYRNATTNGASTIPARSMMFSGRYVQKKRFDILGYSDNLLSKMGNIFFTTSLEDASFSSDFHRVSSRSSVSLLKNLAESYLEVSLPSPLRPYVLDTLLSSWKFDWRGEIPKDHQGSKRDYYGKNMEKIFDNFAQAVSNAEYAKGKLFVLWSMLSHFPYVLNEDGTIHDSFSVSFEVGMNAEKRSAVEKNYVKSLQNVDRLLGQFLTRFQENGLYEQAVILVTSDHGISDTGDNSQVDKQVAAIPFFLKIPGLQTGPSDRDVQTVDVTTTLLDAVGLLPSPSPYDGQSLLEPYTKRDKLMFALGTAGFWTLESDGVWKYKK